MKKTILLPCMLFGIFAYSQVGINNTSPKGTLDVVGGTSDGSRAEGIILPRLTGNALKAADTAGVYGADQDAALVYVTQEPDPANRTGQVEGMDKPGFYYFNSGANRWLSVEIGHGNTGNVDALQCGSSTNYGVLENGEAASGVVTIIPYTGGNGGVYSAQDIPSTGVLGLTASLLSGTLNTGNGTLTVTITGTPTSVGAATFDISIGGQACTITRTVDAAGTIPVTVGINVGTGANPIIKQMMTNNLGGEGIAADATVIEPKHHGNYYQWGRKDPAADATTPAAAIGGWNTSYAANQSWNSGTEAVPVKNTNDPCPTGFRVPTRAEWQGFNTNSVTTNIGTFTPSATNFGAAKKFVNNGTTIIFPTAGSRNFLIGELNDRGYYGFYWSSTETNSANAYILVFHSSSADPSYYPRTYGISVRCISE